MFVFIIRSILSIFLLVMAIASAYAQTPSLTPAIELPDTDNSAHVVLSSLESDDLPLLRGTIEDSHTTSKHITIVLVGDTGFAPHRQRPLPKGVYKHGRWLNWAQTTQKIREQINGDINFANIETVVSDNHKLRPVPKAFNFMTHPKSVKHLVDVGFNLFSMANNHAYDYGAEGVRQSIFNVSSLKGQGLLAHAGIGLNREGALRVPVFDLKDTKFAFGSIGIGAGSGGRARANSRRPGQLGINNSGDHNALMSNLADADADYRMLSIHRGRERNVRPSHDEINRIRNNTLKQGNIDLLIGHHAHVARGVELNGRRLVFYGLGNFLHQGTANMAGAGGCRDYSLLAKVHLIGHGNQKPELAAVEITPITATHVQTVPMSAKTAARRIAILNGLSAKLDNKSQGAKGIRFQPQPDGRGLYCTKSAQTNPETAELCAGFEPASLSEDRIYQAAARSCGRSLSPNRVAKSKKRKSLRHARSHSKKRLRKQRMSKRKGQKRRKFAKRYKSKRYRTNRSARKFATHKKQLGRHHSKRKRQKARSRKNSKQLRVASLKSKRKTRSRRHSRKHRKALRKKNSRGKRRHKRTRLRHRKHRS